MEPAGDHRRLLVSASGPGGYLSAMSFIEYRRKRQFGRSPKPRRRRPRRSDHGPRFVIQHHAARGNPYEFCLEIDGVLVSWTISNGPSVSPQETRMARRTEDHPLEYENVEGVIPDGDDGAGRVIVWDHGTYHNRTEHEMTTCLGRGHLSFRLHGEKLHGGYALTRIREGEDETWLLMKRRDDDADARRNPVRSEPEWVLSGRTLDELS
jgi:DNA ligase D-like protein (predicted 3'-phosphoesterase)